MTDPDAILFPFPVLSLFLLLLWFDELFWTKSRPPGDALLLVMLEAAEAAKCDFLMLKSFASSIMSSLSLEFC